MYNCGFGDCFLIRAPTRSGAEKTILIDCGSFKKQAKSISEIVGQVIADLPVRDGKPRVDLLIATSNLNRGIRAVFRAAMNDRASADQRQRAIAALAGAATTPADFAAAYRVELCRWFLLR